MINSTTYIDWKSIPAKLSREQRNYNDLRGHFAKLATDAARVFSTDYASKLASLEDIIKDASTLAVQHIQRAIDDAIRKLADLKIFDIDREHFTTTYYNKYDSWSSAHEKIAEKFAEIVCSAAEMDAYRTARRESSGQIMGGGFGLEGAVKGIAVAGAANLAIGAAHGLFNLVAKGLNSVVDSGKKDNIFRDPQTKADLVSGLEKSVLDVHLALLDALDASTSTETIFQRVSISDQDKAQRMLTNLQRGLLGNTPPGDVLSQVLTMDPYCTNAYLYALNMDGDADGIIEQVAKLFHLDLLREKRKLVLAAYKDSTEADVITSIREIEELGARLGMPVESEFLKPLKALLEQFDVKARTFKSSLYPKGRLYPTREDAKRAQEEEKKKFKEAFAPVKNSLTMIIKGFLYLLIVLIPLMFVIVGNPTGSGPAPRHTPALEGLSTPYVIGSADPVQWKAKYDPAPAPAAPAASAAEAGMANPGRGEGSKPVPDPALGVDGR